MQFMFILCSHVLVMMIEFEIESLFCCLKCRCMYIEREKRLAMKEIPHICGFLVNRRVNSNRAKKNS